MQAYSTTVDLKLIKNVQKQSDNQDQGFAQEQVEAVVVPHHDVHDDTHFHKNITRPKILYRQPKLKLTFMGDKKQHSRDQLRKSIIHKEQKSSHGRSLDIHKKDSKKLLQIELLSDCLTKIKRTVVADNISIPTFSLADSKNVKNYITTSSGTSSLIYQQPRQINTHGYLRALTAKNPQLLESKMNKLLKLKLKDSIIMPKKQKKQIQQKPLQFQGDYQNANLQFVSQITQNQYELYLRNDTNTHGHQSWFMFRIKNNCQVKKYVTIHVCNLKRNLSMFADGGKICTRKLNRSYIPLSQWAQNGSNYQFKINNNNKFSNVRVYKLTFELTLEPQSITQVSLLPAYTYSDMLQDIQKLQRCKYLTCENLTYSLVGLAIPILTFTKGDSPHKQVILINCRVHPGQANASYMCRGIMKWLSSDSPSVRQFLQRHIVKIIPMINPDGVLFGNFRTNFLGADLNRSFDSDDQITNPQIYALKELGIRLKEQHGALFNLFIDLHGHSSQRNIFTYGPDYQLTETNYYQIRLLPKILNLRSKMFKYHYCSFKLEDYKRYTARGFFLNSINLLAYTVQAGYAFYQSQNQLKSMGIKEWVEFGTNLAQGLHVLSKLNKLSSIKNKYQIKKALGQADKEQVDMIKKFKKEFKVEKQERPKSARDKLKDKGGQDSDGEGDCEDYNRAEKEEVLRRVAQTVAPNIILPRVLKPAILYPTVTPKLFKYRQDYGQTQLKILYTKRISKYSGLRNNGNSCIQNLKGLDILKGDTKNIVI